MRSELVQRLDAPVSPDRVATRRGGRGGTLSYLEGYDVIDTGNSLFGYGNWDHQLIRCWHEERVYFAIVRVTVRLQPAVAGGPVEVVVKEDLGIAIAEIGREDTRDTPASPDAIETAGKGAVTDGTKRAFRHFGNQFGNSLYDKTDPNRAAGSSSSSSSSSRAPSNGQASEAQVNYAATLAKKIGRATVKTWKSGVLDTKELQATLVGLSKQDISDFIEWAKAQSAPTSQE
jgi:DNA repair and recombination protein RAD52